MTAVIEKVSNELVGRQVELDRLDAVLEGVARGGSEVVLVGGEAGVGKSHLTRELTGRAKGRGFQVAVGRCVEFGEEIWPLAPLREMVAGLASELDSEAFDLVIGSARGVLSRLVPEVGGEPMGEGPVDGGRLCELAVGVFRRLAKRGPLLLVVEDLHWADSTTRTLFSLLARAGSLGRAVLVGTYRSDELHRRHPLRPVLAEITRGVRPERFDLEPLDRAGTAEVIAAIGSSVVVDRALVDDIYRLSAGNPFFIEELVAARATGMKGFPETLRDVVLARAATLDETASEVLRVAAAAGPTLPAVLAEVSGVDAVSLAATIDVLVAAALLVPDGEEVRFRHELAREVFYGELAPGERASVHARLARCCEALRPERPGDIARHWAAAHDGPRALVASIAAGRQALRTGAAAEAESHFGRALELWPAVDGAEALVGFDHAALLSEASEAAEYAGDILPAIDLGLRAANELAGEPLREGKVWLQLRDLFRYCSRWDDTAHAVERALALIPPSPPSSARAEALAHAALGYHYFNRLVETTTYAEEAIAVAEAAGDRDALVYARYALAGALSMAGDFERQLSSARETLALCEAGVSAERLLMAYTGMTDALESFCRPAEIVEFAERGVEIARQTGLGGPRGTWLAHSWLGALTDLGRWDEAERTLAELQDMVGAPPEQAQLAYTWGLVLMRQGRLDEARPLVEYARGILQAGHWDDEVAEMAAAVIEFDARERRYDAAASFAAEMVERALRGVPHGAPLLIFVAVGCARRPVRDGAGAQRSRGRRPV